MKPPRWTETIILITMLTAFSIYLIPPDSTLVYIRYALVFVFIFLIPGNCLVNILFRKNNNIDIIEKTVLSVALSFGITGITGLFLGLTPIGLSFTSITISLISITLILAITAYILKNKDNQQNSNHQQAQSIN